MEASTLLDKIRARGFTIRPVGNAISLSPKQRLNDRIINFVREHKDVLLTALYQEQDEKQALHCERKLALHQDKVHTLRILLWRFLKSDKCRQIVNYRGSTEINDQSVEVYLDDELINFDYNLEAMIGMYRIYTPEPKIIDGRCKCGYVQPFCACNNI